MKNWDVIIIGGGIIGVSLSIALRKKGASVLIVERGELGREASHAAGGMLVDCSLETAPALQELASASANMYPEFVHELQVESGTRIDLRDHGTIVLPAADDMLKWEKQNQVGATLLEELHLGTAGPERPVFYLKERSVDPRGLTSAAVQAAKRRGVDFSSGDAVTTVNFSDNHVAGVTTTKTTFRAPIIVNCAGAWSGQIAPHAFPTRPVKGQMLCLAAPSRDVLKYVIRSPEAYLIPRSDGRIVVGTTMEEAGFDKRTDVTTIQRLHHAAIKLVPALEGAKILEDWAGLRPGTPDELPILGATATPGYYVATGHFRDGILLAPVTARLMTDVIAGSQPGYDLTPFSAARFRLL